MQFLREILLLLGFLYIKGELLFIVLNKYGRQCITTTNKTFNIFTFYVSKYIESTSDEKISLINVIRAPLKIFIPTMHSGAVHTNFINYSKSNKLGKKREALKEESGENKPKTSTWKGQA